MELLIPVKMIEKEEGGRKQVGVSSRCGRGWRQESTTNGNGESGVGSKAEKEKERTVIATKFVGIIVISTGKMIINSLITGVTFWEIVLLA